MIEKVNQSHPDTLADRLAGAIVDLAYKKNDRPKIAVEVLIGYELCTIIIQSSEKFKIDEVDEIVTRIAGKQRIHLISEPQDVHLSQNQSEEFRCGDNGIFKGVPVTSEEKELSKIARELYAKYPHDGKFVLDKERLIVCQSNAVTGDLQAILPKAYINPLGDWTGGTNVDVGCTNRKLGSDMAQSVTGGGLHGKDLSKADVSVNIYAFLKAQATGKLVELSCAIGDKTIDGKPYEEIVMIARKFIENLGGFEKFAEWGLF